MQALSRWWKNFETKHTTVAQFIVFFVLSNGITVLQLILMPASRQCSRTQPRRHGLQFLPVGVSNGHTVFLFDYPAGSMSVGGGGGLAYFLAVEITLLIAQVINFFAQRNVTFKSNSSVGKAASGTRSPTSSSRSPRLRSRFSTRTRSTRGRFRQWARAARPSRTSSR